MMTTDTLLTYDQDHQQLNCSGCWDIDHISKIELLFSHISPPLSGQVTIDGSQLSKLDSAGAWLINKCLARLKEKNLETQLCDFSSQHLSLVEMVGKTISNEAPVLKTKPLAGLAGLGKLFCMQLAEFRDFLSFIGLIAIEQLRILPKPSHWRFKSLVGVIYRSGLQGLPIVGLLSFLTGVVITYQLGLQLQNYGANIYIVDLLGLSILREFAPLLTSIMVAGRTGSAFTAELGMMKLNQEIDALDTMGITPAELLIIPRIIGLFIVLPLLTIWADIFGIIGGMMMANNMLDITWYDFIQRFPNVIPLKTLLIGLGKTPVFALIIASVSCFQGMNVSGSAESLGRNTTRSVVLSIFFILVADASFSIIFSELKL